VFLLAGQVLAAQDTTAEGNKHPYKNVIRYDLSGALIFGIDHYIVFGYERLIGHRQSISINFGRASLPKIISLATDSFSTSKDLKRTGYNFSVDYRFYLARENKYAPPHGFYIGPYYSFNDFQKDNVWNHKNSTASSNITTHSNFNIHTVGFELGYQLIVWKRLALDFIMVGPGLGFYHYKASFDSNIDVATQEQLLDGLKQLLTQKFPGMNVVFSDKEFSADGVMKTSAIGYRYIFHIGFNF
jgi:hypothetical protein